MARRVWGRRDVKGSECFALAPLQWQETEKSVLGSSQLLCYSFAPFLLCVLLLKLLQGLSLGILMGRGWAAPEVACHLHPLSKPLKLLQRPMHLTGDLHWPWWAAARRGCVWAGDVRPGQPHPAAAPPAQCCWLAAERSVRQIRVAQSLTNESCIFQTHFVGIALISQCLNALQNLRN